MTSLEMLKRQLNLVGTTDDDAQLSLYLETAIEMTRKQIGAETLDFDEAPAPLKLAVMMLAAHYYENREATTDEKPVNPIPFGYLDICASYRTWEFD